MEQHLVNDYLHRAIEELHTNPLSTQLIRRLASEEPDFFTKAALSFLETDGHTGAHRYLSALLLRQSDIFDRLANPAEGSKRAAVKLFRRLLAVDPSFDVKLARKLPDRNGANRADAYEGMRAARVLDILDETSRGRRLVPVLSHLVNSLDPRTCARATLFVGRRIQNPLWTARQLQRPDDQIRANAVESIWGMNSIPAVQLLETCVNDQCNRVAGNSLVGLHMAGQSGILERLAEMSVHAEPKFRSTAAWAMGRVGDPIFAPVLNLLVRDRDSRVRSAALRSLIELRKADTRPLEDIAAQAAEIALSPEPAEDEFTIDENQPIPEFPEFDLKLDGSNFATRSQI